MIVFSDNFTRADSTGLGANYTSVGAPAGFDIVSNRAVPHSTSVDCFALLVPSIKLPVGMTIRFKVGTIGVGPDFNQGIGIIFKCDAALRNWFRLIVSSFGSAMQISQNGSASAYWVDSTPWVNGDEGLVVLPGPNLAGLEYPLVYRNNVLLTVPGNIVPADTPSPDRGFAGVAFSASVTSVGSLSLFELSDIIMPPGSRFT